MAAKNGIETIQQVEFNRKLTEYQYFPEEYFTGADVAVYFGDVWMDEITGLSFKLSENVKPLFGYASHTWDGVARGNRVVIGEFRVAFKEAGYLHLVMDHLGQLQDNAKPRLAYLMGGEQVPKWVAGVKEGIEDTLTKYHGDPNAKSPDTTKKETFLDEYEWPDNLKLGATDKNNMNKANRWRPGGYGSISQLQYRLIELGYNWNDKKFNWKKYSRVPVSNEAKQANGWPSDYYMMRRFDNNDTVIAKSSERSKYNVSNPDEVELQRRLNEYPGLQKLNMSGSSSTSHDGRYGFRTTEGVAKFQKLAGINDGSNGRWVSERTKTELEKGLNVNGTFDLPTKVAVMLFQEKNGLTVDGIVGPATRKKLSPNGTKSVTVPGKSLYKPEATAEPKYAQYEREVWGRSFSANTHHRNRTFFYDETLALKGGAFLKKHGFDIYITYGPYPENVIKYKGQYGTAIDGSPVAFNTTVKAIRNVQLTDVTQVIDASGQPIEEVYSFIAQDID